MSEGDEGLCAVAIMGEMRCLQIQSTDINRSEGLVVWVDWYVG